MPFAGSKRSTMTVVPARRQVGRARRRKSGSNVHVQNYGNLCIGATAGIKRTHQIDAGHTLSQEESTVFGGTNGGSDESSDSDTPRVSQEDEFPATPQYSNSNEGLAHAIVRGFRMGAAKKLPEFLERRASPSNATTENMVEIKESRLNGDALVITVKAVDLSKITGINGVLFAGTRLMIRPYRAKGSGPQRHVGPAKGTGVSQMEPSIQIPKADSPRLASNESEGRAQPSEISLPTSPCLESSKPDVNTTPLPASTCVAAAAPTESLQQKEPNLAAPEQTVDVSKTSNTITEIIKEEMAIQLSKCTGISLPISHLCLSQSDYDQGIAVEAINFAADFASPNGLALQASILCLDNSLWDMEDAALVAGTVAKEVSDGTGMTMDWAIECLHATGWTLKGALEGFEAVKELLPREAFK